METLASVENLFLATASARRNKSTRPDVEAWCMTRETEIARLRKELLSGAYTPGGYRFFEIHEPKQRLIAAAPFRDRVVHHALCNVMAPLLMRRFVARSFSCQVGKGTAREHGA
jgi:RNA-directed DNA polymerase